MSEPMPSFRTKDFASLTDQMILTCRAHTGRVTDWNAGSVARTLLEAPALEIDALYQAMVLNLLDSIPTAIYQGFDFAALPAVAASGWVTFTYVPGAAETRPVHISQGTVVRNPAGGPSYATLTEGIIPVNGLTVTVAVACVEAGASGNTWAGALTAHNAGPQLTSTNTLPITGGRSEETVSERRQRFILYLQTLARGTVAALQYAATIAAVTTDTGTVIGRAARMAVEEGPGHVNLWIYGTGGVPTAALLAEIRQNVEGYYDDVLQQWIPGYRPAGMRVDVLGMSAVLLPVSMELDALLSDRTATLLAAVTEAIQQAIQAEPSGGMLRPAELLNAALLVPKINGARLLSPTTAYDVPYNAALEPGTITLTWNPES